MAKKTDEEQRREDAYQRDLGKRGISTGSSANYGGLQDYRAKEARDKRNAANNEAFIKSAKQTAGGGGCLIAVVITSVLGISLGVLVFGPALW